MISLKKYLDSPSAGAQRKDAPKSGLEPPQPCAPAQVIAACQAALREMGSCSVEACPALGPGLQQSLASIADKLSIDLSRAAVEASERGIQAQLQDWGRRTAQHYREKASEVKALLIVMARTAESVGERDRRCAGQISEVTGRLEKIACLEDLSEIRSSIERSAAELKISLGRMAEEGKQAIAALRAEVSSYQTKLEEAEELASRDALTGLHNRAWVEQQIECRLTQNAAFSVAIVDIDDFKRVNDKYGHLVGDELLGRFSKELKAASRSTDVIGRWGGDEFILVLDCGLAEAGPQIERLRAWVCGDYPVQARHGSTKLNVQASIGLADRVQRDTMQELLARADAAMYMCKKASGAKADRSRR